MYNNYHMFGNELNNIRLTPQQKASNCVECGLCETQCPQGIQIREELKNVRAVFEENLEINDSLNKMVINRSI